MANQKIFNNQDLQGLSIKNFKANPLTTVERTAYALTLGVDDVGAFCYDTDELKPFTWDGTAFTPSDSKEILIVDADPTISVPTNLTATIKLIYCTTTNSFYSVVDPIGTPVITKIGSNVVNLGAATNFDGSKPGTIQLNDAGKVWAVDSVGNGLLLSDGVEEIYATWVGVALVEGDNLFDITGVDPLAFAPTNTNFTSDFTMIDKIMTKNSVTVDIADAEAVVLKKSVSKDQFIINVDVDVPAADVSIFAPALSTGTVVSYDYDIVFADIATNGITDQATFEAFLGTVGYTNLVVSDFLLEGNRVRAKVASDVTTVSYLSQGIVSGSKFGNIVSVQILFLNNNSIVTFNPAVALPNSLQNIGLANNQIVTFDPTIALPTGLLALELGNNQIATFNPSIALPSGLLTITLTSNQIVTFNPTIALPVGLKNLYLPGNKIVTFNPSIPLPNGLDYLNLDGNEIVSFNPSASWPSGLFTLLLSNNKMTTAGYTASEPWANSLPAAVGKIINFSGNIDSVTGTNLENILVSKGYNVIA